MNDTLINKISEHLEKGNIFIFIAIYILIYSLKNWKQIIDYYGEHKKSKINAITEALKSEYVKGFTRTYLEEALESEHFRMSTGIKLEKEFREALLQVYKKAKGELTLKHIKRALPYLEYKNEQLHIKMKWATKFSFLALFLMSIFLFIYGTLGMIIISFYGDNFTFQQITKIIINCCIYFITSIIFFGQTFPHLAVIKIEKIFKKHQEVISKENNYSI